MMPSTSATRIQTAAGSFPFIASPFRMKSGLSLCYSSAPGARILFLSAVHIQVLLRAAEILGGNAQLRAYLRVSIHELEAWMSGRERVPSHIFLRTVDLISAPATSGEPEEVR